MASLGRLEKSVVIVQSYVPSYRRPLFEQLRDRLREDGVNLRLVTSRPARQQRKRGDETRLDCQDVVRGFSLKFFGRTLGWKAVVRKTRAADLVVCELSSGSLENYTQALRHKHGLASWDMDMRQLPSPTDSILLSNGG